MNTQQYSGTSTADTSRTRSNFWADCPIDSIIHGNRDGIHFFDDFAEFTPIGFATGNVTALTTVGGVGGKYKAFSSLNGTITPVNAVPTTAVAGGILRMNNTGNNEATNLSMACAPFLLNNTAGKLWFEARVAMTSIITNNMQMFVGLGETTAMANSVTVPLDGADLANTSGSMIGFNVLEDGVGVINSCYQDRSTTWTNVKASLTTAMVANTFIKLGMSYSPTDTTNAVTFYVNGVKQANVISAATLTALTSLDVKGLGMCIALYNDTAGTDQYVYLDWWRCAQLIG